MNKLRRAFITAIGLCLLPLAGVLLSTLIAGVLGCELSEGAVEPCSLLGLDIGGLLSSLFFTGWFALFTLPLIAVILALWALLEGGIHWRRRRSERKAIHPGTET